MNLVLVGAVIIASIRRVLQGAARALRATPASRNRVASLVLLVLAQLMARAFLSAHGDNGTNNARAGALWCDRAYIYSQRSYSFTLRSRLRRTVLTQDYLRCFRPMRLLDWYSIGVSLRVPLLPRR
jgi:hypothetical protein